MQMPSKRRWSQLWIRRASSRALEGLQPRRAIPVSTLRWTETGRRARRASRSSTRTRSLLWTVTAMALATTSLSSPETIAPRTRIGMEMPARRSSIASCESPTPSRSTPWLARCHPTGIASWPYAFALTMAMIRLSGPIAARIVDRFAVMASRSISAQTRRCCIRNPLLRSDSDRGRVLRAIQWEV